MKPHSNFEDEIDGYEGETNWWDVLLVVILGGWLSYLAAHFILWLV